MNYSYSAISSFKSCPRAFEYKYIHRSKEAFISVERYMGSCVHEALHWAYLQRREQIEPGIRQIGEEYERRWKSGEIDRVRIIKTENSLDDYFDSGMKLCGAFFQNVFSRDNSVTLHLEHHFELELGNRFSYRGIIDRISRQPGGAIRVTDFKTGTVSHPLDNFQLPSYALYIFKNHEEDSVELCLEDLATPRTMVARFERNQVQRIETELGREIDAINRATLFPTNPGILCLWCGYNHICPDAPETAGESVAAAEHQGVLKPGPGEEEEKRYCPDCGSLLEKREGKFGPFWGCSHFPDCRYTLDIKKPGVLRTPGDPAEDICPECGATLRKRKGKFGPFWGCSNYPSCRFTRKIK